LFLSKGILQFIKLSAQLLHLSRKTFDLVVKRHLRVLLTLNLRTEFKNCLARFIVSEKSMGRSRKRSQGRKD
jgi:hypothetical protein